MNSDTIKVHEPATLAEPGYVYEVGDRWRCQCGREYSFGMYAAAHWDDVLTFDCVCGSMKTFCNGEVLENE